MIRKLLTAGLGIIIMVSLMSCKGNEQQVAPKTAQPPLQMQPVQPQTPPLHGAGISKSQVNVVVPESVKGKWVAVKLNIEEKAKKKKQEITVNLNSEYKVPDSDLKIVVGEFLPGFTMDEGRITSSSAEPTNPAVGIRVYEGDKQIFPAPGKQWGWLFSKMPDIHPFEHPKFNITLKDGVRKS
ncbi:MAG: DUF2155 domain-containing protein [Nitrospirota bacterium]